MSLLRSLIRPFLYTRYGVHRLTGSGAFGNGPVRYVRDPVVEKWNPLKKALWQSHVKQIHASSCSVASVVSCINALRRLADADAPAVGQTEILERVATGHWKARMSDEGYHGRRGLPLPLLGQVVKDSITAYGLDVRRVDIVPTPKHPPSGSSVPAVLKTRLDDFDHRGDGLIIAHFDQGTVLPTLNIPHISPVGGYDAAAGLVTLLDVDPEVIHPYQVSFDTFYKALSTDYVHLFRAFGYGSGGYVYIQIH